MPDQRASPGFGPTRSRRAPFPAMLVALLPLPTACTRPAPPPRSGTLVLDADAPFVDGVLAGVPVRLRVTPAAQAAVALAPGVAARLPLRWTATEPIDVGRVRLAGRAALAELAVGGTTVPVQVEDHGRAPGPDGDGEVAPGVLPYAAVVWRRPAAPEPTRTTTLPLRWDGAFGYVAEAGVAGVVVRFDPALAEDSATASAGARLAQAWGGRWEGDSHAARAAFGVERPVRLFGFARPGTLAGFPVAALPVRLADFAGRDALPTDPPRPGDVVVSHRVTPQRGWPAVTLGADRLRRCREMLFTVAPLALTLRCAS